MSAGGQANRPCHFSRPSYSQSIAWGASPGHLTPTGGWLVRCSGVSGQSGTQDGGRTSMIGPLPTAVVLGHAPVAS
jgi:hypothetical protein